MDHPGTTARDERQFTTALARGLEILRAFQPDEPHLSNREIAARTGLPRPTVSRLTYTLTELGYLVHLPKLRRYRLSPSVLALGYTALAQSGIREVARPHMRALAAGHRVSVNLGVRDRLEIMYVEVVRSAAAAVMGPPVGARLPMVRTAVGRAYLAGLPAAERKRLLHRLRRLHEANGESFEPWQELVEKAVESVARDGYCLAIGTWHKELNAIAAPIRTSNANEVYALTVGGIASLAPPEKLTGEIAPGLLAINRAIESDLQAYF